MAKIRTEINLLNYMAGTAANTTGERIQFDPAQYSAAGSVTYYFEVTAYLFNPGSVNVTMTDGGSNSFTVAVTSVPAQCVKALITTPPAGVYYVIAPSTVHVVGARILVYLDSGSATSISACEHQIEIGSQSNVTATAPPTGSTANNQNYPKYWYYDSTLWDGTVTAYFEASFVTPTSKSAATCLLQVADGTGNGFTGWSNVANSTVTTTNQYNVTAALPKRSTAITLTSGRWYRLASYSPTSKSAVGVYCAKIIIRQSGFTKCQPQYLQVNQPIGLGGSGVQGYVTNWDPSDWNNVNNTYAFQVEDPTTTDVINLVTEDNVNVLATVSNPAAPAVKVTASMPATAYQLDVALPTNPSITLYTAQILVNCAIQPFTGTSVSPAAASLHFTVGTPTVTGVATIKSPAKATLAISAKTPTLKMTYRPAPTTAALAISPKTPTVSIASAVVTEMAMIV